MWTQQVTEAAEVQPTLQKSDSQIRTSQQQRAPAGMMYSMTPQDQMDVYPIAVCNGRCI